MTYDELLTKVERQTVLIANKIKPVADSCEKEIGSFANALRAVVELHKSEDAKDAPFCLKCLCKYPCETIQAIEKELG